MKSFCAAWGATPHFGTGQWVKYVGTGCGATEMFLSR